ncbi:MAG: SDR family oxidoreductase [Herbiconiux sp.]|uniref:SDR family oxidoreductase n=1 Tax=Herbiconiux sp. TaxID=1871186 RepID=UPI00122A8A57|nr:SDR family oxidoreductase [Herbiconiux sp.]TAJ49104.1 MAG: SDR family oxidoreductase [Herbiconiux sp.]
MTAFAETTVTVVAPTGAVEDEIVRVLQRDGARLVAADQGSNAGIFIAGSPREYGLRPLDVGTYVREILDRAGALLHSISLDETRSRSITLIAPSAGQTLHGGLEATSAAIGALKGFSRAVVVKYGDRGLRSNVILPGIYETDAESVEALPSIPLIRDRGVFTRPGDVAECAAFLVSEDAGYISGAEFDVDGALSEDRHSAMSVLWSKNILAAGPNPVEAILMRSSL